MKIKSIILAIVLFMFFSLSSVFMKLASLDTNLINKLFHYCLSMGVLGIFAIVWQKLLVKYDLSKVYFFKSTTIIWGMVFGYLIFHETITLQMIIGSIITICGVVLVIGGKENE